MIKRKKDPPVQCPARLVALLAMPCPVKVPSYVKVKSTCFLLSSFKNDVRSMKSHPKTLRLALAGLTPAQQWPAISSASFGLTYNWTRPIGSLRNVACELLRVVCDRQKGTGGRGEIGNMVTW